MTRAWVGSGLLAGELVASGCSLIARPPAASATLTVAERFTVASSWGWGFLGLGVLLAAAVLARAPRSAALAHGTCAAVYATYGSALIAPAVLYATAWSGGTRVLALGAAHFLMASVHYQRAPRSAA